MKLIRAEHLGMCFGVRDAITLAKQTAAKQPITILGELVHNEVVVDDLKRHGVKIEHELEKATTPTVMITAHGASEKKLDHVRRNGFKVLEATCPLVHFAHRSLQKLVEQGYHPVIIGKRDHVEVRGMTEDLDDHDVVLSEADIAVLNPRSKFGVIAQTTQPIDRVRGLVRLLQKQFPSADVRFVDTVCQPTKQRQNSAIELSKACDVVVVIGGANSNNTRELVATCSNHCARIHHVQSARDLNRQWFFEDDVVGITAGTSTPDQVIDEVEQTLANLFQPQPAAISL